MAAAGRGRGPAAPLPRCFRRALRRVAAAPLRGGFPRPRTPGGPTPETSIRVSR